MSLYVPSPNLQSSSINLHVLARTSNLPAGLTTGTEEDRRAVKACNKSANQPVSDNLHTKKQCPALSYKFNNVKSSSNKEHNWRLHSQSCLWNGMHHLTEIVTEQDHSPGCMICCQTSRPRGARAGRRCQGAIGSARCRTAAGTGSTRRRAVSRPARAITAYRRLPAGEATGRGGRHDMPACVFA